MWILRFHRISSKDYNKITRVCKKHGFSPRKHSAVSYAKAFIKYKTQKTSYRALSREFWIDHISLYHFVELSESSGLDLEIFHIFLQGRFSLYVGEIKNFTESDLNNSEEIYVLTQKAFKSML